MLRHWHEEGQYLFYTVIKLTLKNSNIILFYFWIHHQELVLDRKRKHERNAALQQVEVIRFVKDVDGDEAVTQALLVDLLTRLDEEAHHTSGAGGGGINSQNASFSSSSFSSNTSVIPLNSKEGENGPETEAHAHAHLPLLDALSCFATDDRKTDADTRVDWYPKKPYLNSRFYFVFRIWA